MSLVDKFEDQMEPAFTRSFDRDSARRQFRVSLLLVAAMAMAAFVRLRSADQLACAEGHACRHRQRRIRRASGDDRPLNFFIISQQAWRASNDARILFDRKKTST